MEWSRKLRRPYCLAKRLDLGPDVSAFAEMLDPYDLVGEVFKNRNQTPTSPQLDVVIIRACFIREIALAQVI
jgi:hypothetical protein